MSEINIYFKKQHHFWMDAGLSGLCKIALYEKNNNIKVIINEDGVYFIGEEAELDSFLNKIYNSLLKQYYNTSSPNQITKNEGVYLDTKTNTLVRFPKMKPTGIAGLIFSKTPKPEEDVIKYNSDGTLPEPYSQLQEMHDKFFNDNKLKHGGSLLINAPNSYKPNCPICVKKSDIKPNKKNVCFFCGETQNLMDITGTVFPLIGGTSGTFSFNNRGSKVEKVCWKCNFVSKFVPAVGFYSDNNDKLHIYIPYSSDLNKMIDINKTLDSSKINNIYKNFKDMLGGYYYKPHEQLFSFLYSTYATIISGKANLKEGENFNYEEDFGIKINTTPVEFFVLYLEPLGQTSIGKIIWNFKESMYLFKLFNTMEKNQVKIDIAMKSLVDYGMNNNEQKTIIRNKICQRILNKQTILDLVEKHVFRLENKFPELLKFTIIYEKIIKEKVMKQELIDLAVKIGKNIGINGKKGDIFRLRKTRTHEDFLIELGRFQLRYGVNINSELLVNGEIFINNFTEFKGFCMIAAINQNNSSYSTTNNKVEE